MFLWAFWKNAPMCNRVLPGAKRLGEIALKRIIAPQNCCNSGGRCCLGEAMYKLDSEGEGEQKNATRWVAFL